MCAAVDTQDLKWQVDVKCSPDKAAEWKYPLEKDGWVLAHNAIRYELASIREALAKLAERRRLLKWEIDCLQVVWGEHQAHVRSHHSNEEDLMVPFLTTRFSIPEKLHDDHTTLLRMMDELQQRIQGLTPNGWEQVAALHEAWVAYEEMMLPHLLEEELTQLPLMHAYFTPKEVTPIIQKIVARGPPCEAGSMICTMGDEAFFDFMKQEGIPGFVWYIDFKGKRDRFRKLFIQNLEAVSKGEPPRRGGLFACCQAESGQTQAEEVVEAKAA